MQNNGDIYLKIGSDPVYNYFFVTLRIQEIANRLDRVEKLKP